MILRRALLGVSSLLSTCVLAATAQADYLFYNIPGTRQFVVLQGRVDQQQDRQVTYTHPGLKQSLNFPASGVRVLKVPTTREQYQKRIVKAKGDAAACYETAVWALKHGLLAEFHKGVDRTLESDPKHAAALKVKELKAEIEKPLPKLPEQEAELRKLVPNAGMKIAYSDHFVLLHDSVDPPPVAGRARVRRRSEARLDLLEQVYESFLMLFAAQDVTLDVPTERLKVVLFNDVDDYNKFSKSLDPELASAAGYWDPVRNVSVFYDHGTDERFRMLKRISDGMQKRSKEMKQARTPESFETTRFANTIQTLVDIAQENSDVEVVSHEATHQMAGNTGLFPRYVRVPQWCHEGLATYFESPGEAGWSGIGAVNEQRLEWYRGLEADLEHSNVDFIVGDQIFKFAASHGARLHGYGQAWALTHFLMEKHLTKTVEFYRRLGEMPPDSFLNPDLLTALFNEVFAAERKSLDREWRGHMRDLKPDFQVIMEEAARN